MQATGNNTDKRFKEVSTQLSLGGHSFSEAGANLRPVPADDAGSLSPLSSQRSTVALDTHRVALIPEELFRAEDAETYLRTDGLAPTEGERTVLCDPVGGIAAVAAFDGGVLDAVRRAEPHARFVSPLQLLAAETAPSAVQISVQGPRVYLTVRGEALRYAHVLPFDGDADLVYYLARLGELFPIKDYTIYIYAEAPTCKTLSRYWRNVKRV